MTFAKLQAVRVDREVQQGLIFIRYMAAAIIIYICMKGLWNCNLSNRMRPDGLDEWQVATSISQFVPNEECMTRLTRRRYQDLFKTSQSSIRAY